MIKKLFFTALLTITFLGASNSHECHNLTPDLKTSEFMVKAINYNGEIIPLINLPEVVITAKSNNNMLVKANSEKKANNLKKLDNR